MSHGRCTYSRPAFLSTKYRWQALYRGATQNLAQTRKGKKTAGKDFRNFREMLGKKSRPPIAPGYPAPLGLAVQQGQGEGLVLTLVYSRNRSKQINISNV